MINYFKDTKEEAKEKVRNSDIIFFTGGLPDKMMYRLEEFHLVNEKINTVYAIRDTGGIIIDNEKITLLGDTQIFKGVKQ